MASLSAIAASIAASIAISAASTATAVPISATAVPISATVAATAAVASTAAVAAASTSTSTSTASILVGENHARRRRVATAIPARTLVVQALEARVAPAAMRERGKHSTGLSGSSGRRRAARASLGA